MNQHIPNPRARALVRRLVAYEAGPGNAPAAAFRVLEKLRRPLSALVGATGFRALLARALTLAKAQVDGLDGLLVKPDGSLEGLASLPAEQASEAGAAVIAQILALLGVFIGEDLTRRLLVDTWPGLPAIETGPYGESRDDPTG